MPPRRSDQPERTFWEVFPRRSVRRALLLLALLGAVLVLRRTGGLALSNLIDGLVPPSRAHGTASPAVGATAPAPSFQKLRVVPAPGAGSGAGGAHP